MSKATTEDDYKSIAQRFVEMGSYGDAEKLAKECLEKADEARIKELERIEIRRKDLIYANAFTHKKSGRICDLELAIVEFKKSPTGKIHKN